MSKKGQALIEAIAGLSLSALFFASCLKLWTSALNDLKSEVQTRENQLCKMSGANKCRPDAGFVLVTMLMQLTVLIFSSYILVALFLGEEFKWKISNWCFENTMANVSGTTSSPESDITVIENEMNRAAPLILQFKTYLRGPVRSESPASGLTESYYNIHWVTTSNLKQRFLKTDEVTNQLKCGARKLCHDENCVYTLIADKS